MGIFRRRPRPADLERLLEQRAQLLAELDVVQSDAAWAGVSDDREDLAGSKALGRQADALRRALTDLDRNIAAARDAQQGG
jgi:hypothetical protein